MCRLCFPLHRLLTVLSIVATWLVTATPAWAQEQKPAAKSYTTQYLMIVLVVALGLLLVLRSPGRRSDIRPKTSA